MLWNGQSGLRTGLFVLRLGAKVWCRNSSSHLSGIAFRLWQSLLSLHSWLTVHFATANESFAENFAYHERRRMQPVCTVKAFKKKTTMDSNTIGLRAVIIGPKGLRAGWRLLIFLLMLLAMGAVARAIIIRFLIPAGFDPEKFTPSKVAVPDAFFVFIIAVAAWVMSKIEGSQVGQYGLPVKQRLIKHLWLGLWMGFLASSATVLIIYLLHGFQIASPTIRGTTILTSALPEAVHSCYQP